MQLTSVNLKGPSVVSTAPQAASSAASERRRVEMVMRLVLLNSLSCGPKPRTIHKAKYPALLKLMGRHSRSPSPRARHGDGRGQDRDGRSSWVDARSSRLDRDDERKRAHSRTPERDESRRRQDRSREDDRKEKKSELPPF
jgi:hypothetical protein